MDRRHDEEGNMVAQVYEASLNGCVSTLNTLIQRDPLILDRVSLTSLSETPLHIAALHGNLDFCRALVSKKPRLAEEVDSLGRTPLHLASAEGHTEIVQALLQTNNNVCLTSDQDGRIPLHLAAMRGRIEILKELIIAQRESIQLNDLNGDSILHMCIRYSHLEALKSLVELDDCNEILNSKDHDGNSILHLAVILKQMKAIKYLLSVPKIKRETNAMNKIGYTALDVLEVCSRDFKCFEIQNILKRASVKGSADLNSSLPTTPSGIGVDEALEQFGHQAQSRVRTRWECVRLAWERLGSSLGKHGKQQGDWIKETRGKLMVAATVTASMAFQAGISPPGGVWQPDASNSTKGSLCAPDYECEVGTAVLSYSYHSTSYLFFLIFNSTSFFASMCIILLVISGLPLTNKFIIWVLALAMTTSAVSMTLAYAQAMILVTPEHILKKFFLFGNKLDGIFFGVLVIVGLVHIVRPLFWMVRNLRKFRHKSTRGPTDHDSVSV